MLKDFIFGTMGGLGLFLFGMGLMSDGLKKVAGQRLKSLLESLTKHRLVAVMVGALVTCLIQSSSATTVMTVGFVNAGLLTLKQALSVVLGANIGTTFTAWLVSYFALFKITSYAMPMIGIGFLLSIVCRTEKHRSVGEILLGLGLLFIGIHFMKETFAPLQHHEQVQQALIRLGSHPILAVLAGTAITMLLQSSSASIAMIQMLAFNGAFGSDWNQVLSITIPYILGDNIGTTITAQLAALRSSRNAKRVAMGHTLFNIIGVMYILPLVMLGWFGHVVQWLTPGGLSQTNIMFHLALAHSTFNVFNTLIFLPILRILEISVTKLIPITQKERSSRPIALENHLLETPIIALQQAKKEIIRMAQTAKQALELAVRSIINNDISQYKTVDELEDLVDQQQLEITSYLTALSRKQLSDEVAVELPVLLHTVNDLERIGDHAQNIVELARRKSDLRMKFSEPARHEGNQIQTEILHMFDQVISSLTTNKTEGAVAALDSEVRVDTMQLEFRRSHVERMTNAVCTPEIGIIFIDMVDNIEKVGDHLTNIAQAIIGGLQWGGIEPEFLNTDLNRDPDAVLP